MIDEDDCRAIGGMKIGRGNRSTRRKPAPAPLCPPQIPHDQTRARTPGRFGGKPATNCLSYGAALMFDVLLCVLPFKLYILTILTPPPHTHIYQAQRTEKLNPKQWMCFEWNSIDSSKCRYLLGFRNLFWCRCRNFHLNLLATLSELCASLYTLHKI
jgi:hypothetical protein